MESKKPNYIKNVYGNGRAAEKIVNILRGAKCQK